jgi:hypothetical protein
LVWLGGARRPPGPPPHLSGSVAPLYGNATYWFRNARADCVSSR